MKFRVVFAALVIGATSLFQSVTAPPVHAYPSSQVQFIGHGFGHGRGLSQYGSYGYAKDIGWNYQQILDHYYGGTSLGSIAPLSDISVRLTVNEVGGAGRDMIITSPSNFNVGGRGYAGGTAARVRLAGGTFFLDEGPSCGGPWAQVANGGGGPVVAYPQAPNQGVSNPDRNQLLTLCAANGKNYTYRGNLRAANDSGQPRTVNTVYLEDYLLGVVPRESPASWGSSGGMEALKAQAVAARSYARASGSYSYAQTCDSTACQVYGGLRNPDDGSLWEDSRTNTAVTATANQVRFKNGTSTVARTEFSSSSGGYTTGGEFPAVVDDGDATSSNPNHTWTANVNVATIEAVYPSIGSLQAINITGRNGLGEWGGRVASMMIIGTNGTVTTSGPSFRSAIGVSAMKSDWFNVLYQASGGIGGYWLMGSDGGIFTYGNAPFYGSMGGRPLNKPVVGLSPTADTHGYWLVASDGGVFSFGNAQFFGSMGGHRLNQPVVTMTPTPTGGGYWQVASDGGIFAFGDAGFYGSTGSMRLNKPIVGMAATPTGHGYWLVASDGGIFAFGDAGFYGSMGGVKLRAPVVGMAATPTGHGYWMVAADGGIFAFGDAGFYGALSSGETATGITPTVTGGGYLISTANGNVRQFGDAPFFGSMAGQRFVGTMTGIARSFQ